MKRFLICLLGLSVCIAAFTGCSQSLDEYEKARNGLISELNEYLDE